MCSLICRIADKEFSISIICCICSLATTDEYDIDEMLEMTEVVVCAISAPTTAGANSASTCADPDVPSFVYIGGGLYVAGGDGDGLYVAGGDGDGLWYGCWR